MVDDDSADGSSLARDGILAAVGELERHGLQPEDIADALLVIGANAIEHLIGAEQTAVLLTEMAKELRQSLLN
jgi:hypothetical protein